MTIAKKAIPRVVEVFIGQTAKATEGISTISGSLVSLNRFIL
jgi:hypothetical protein